MMNWKLVFFICFQLSNIYSEAPVVSNISFGPIQFTSLKNGESNKRYIWLHGDEQTARMALERHMKTNKGKAFLVTGIVRELDFFGGIIDPTEFFLN